MSIQSRLVEYVDADLVFEGRLVWDDALPGPRPGVLVALATLREQAEVDQSKTAAMGFCFGGLCVLDLARTGWDDPLAKPDAVLALAQELTAAGADWQLHGYGHTMHAFSNPAASDPQGGKPYNESADRRSWAATRYFLAELFD